MSWTVVPAYGRDYTSRKAVLEDWKANKDFQIAPSGLYVNREDLAATPENERPSFLCFRYGKLRKVYAAEVAKVL